jgi:hypothetical protein
MLKKIKLLSSVSSLIIVSLFSVNANASVMGCGDFMANAQRYSEKAKNTTDHGMHIFEKAYWAVEQDNIPLACSYLEDTLFTFQNAQIEYELAEVNWGYAVSSCTGKNKEASEISLNDTKVDLDFADYYVQLITEELVRNCN